ncbi:MAG: folate family ECF transporter S component [Clostridia bacterium]|nr:folate family ECF transporter S component [Clostridia bacterium]
MKKNLHLRRLCCLALLTAVEIVLNRFCSINTSALKIGFSFVPIVVAASVFGPLGGAVSYGLADLIGAILFPIGTYHPGFTVCAALMGFTYGIFLCTPNKWSGKFALKWKKIRFFPNVIVPAVVNNLVFGLVINTCWVAMLYGSKTYFGWFVYRLPEYAVLIPLNVVLIPLLLKLSDELKRQLDRI